MRVYKQDGSFICNLHAKQIKMWENDLKYLQKYLMSMVLSGNMEITSQMGSICTIYPKATLLNIFLKIFGVILVLFVSSNCFYR